MNKKGIVLIAIIFLIIFIAIAIFGVTTFIAQRLWGYNSEQTIERCRSNAKAGVAYAIYQFRANATSYSGTVTIDSTNSATVTTTGGGGGGAAASLIIDATGSVLGGGGNKDITGVTLNNNSASSITLTQFTISCAGGDKKLDQININGSPVWTTDTTIGVTPVTLNMTDVSIPAGATYNINFVRWANNMSGRTITLSFIMSDSSPTNTCTIYPAPVSTCTTSGSLTITSIGKTADPKYYKTVVATYNTSTGKVTAYTATN